MKLIMENFRCFLKEAYEVKSTGIVKLNPEGSPKDKALALQSKLMPTIEGAKPLHPEHLHITLLHQQARPAGVSGGKWNKVLTKVISDYENPIDLEDKVTGPVQSGGRTSWLIFVDENTQVGLENYVKAVLLEVGLAKPDWGLDESAIDALIQAEGKLLVTKDYAEPKSLTRRFHISLANVSSDPAAKFANKGESVA